MKRSTAMSILMMLGFGLLANQAWAEHVESLRGANPMAEPARRHKQ